jgi:hypothetical protein
VRGLSQFLTFLYTNPHPNRDDPDDDDDSNCLMGPDCRAERRRVTFWQMLMANPYGAQPAAGPQAPFCRTQVEGTRCNDGDACTTGDACSAGECVSTGVLACTGLTNTCVGGTCTCGGRPPCDSRTATKCEGGVCKCGDELACTGKSHRCDNGVCKCGARDGPCGDSFDSCVDGKCVCKGALATVSCTAAADTCEKSAISIACKCGASAACSGQSDMCVNGGCKCGAGTKPCDASFEGCTDGQCVCRGTSCDRLSVGVCYLNELTSTKECLCGDFPPCLSGEICQGGACSALGGP